MSYSFNPLSDEELDSFSLLPEGEYSFLVAKSTRKTSKSGNAMAELVLTLWDVNGKPVSVFDYLVFSNVNLNIKKVSHFSKTTGLYEEYKKGELPEELEGLEGKLELGTQDAQPKPGGGFYAKKNVVIDYIPMTAGEMKASAPVVHDDFSDQIPF